MSAQTKSLRLASRDEAVDHTTTTAAHGTSVGGSI